MELTAQLQGAVTVILIKGSVDTLTAETVSNFINDQILQENVQIVVDLSLVDYVSSAGLRVLLGAAKATRQKGGDFRLAAAGRDTLDVLEMAGFTSILKHYLFVSEAVSSFEG